MKGIDVRIDGYMTVQYICGSAMYNAWDGRKGRGHVKRLPRSENEKTKERVGAQKGLRNYLEQHCAPVGGLQAPN